MEQFKKNRETFGLLVQKNNRSAYHGTFILSVITIILGVAIFIKSGGHVYGFIAIGVLVTSNALGFISVFRIPKTYNRTVESIHQDGDHLIFKTFSTRHPAFGSFESVQINCNADSCKLISENRKYVISIDDLIDDECIVFSYGGMNFYMIKSCFTDSDVKLVLSKMMS